MQQATKGKIIDEQLLELSSQIDRFEGYKHSHGLRIAEIANAIGVRLNLSEHDRLLLQQAALVHDIGEMVMNRSYINETRPITEDERFDLQRHPVIGEQETAKRGFERGVQLLVRWHHEWWNGSGYPDALSGEQIPLAARILRVADSYSALTDDRPRRARRTDDEARTYLIECAAIEFDPFVVKTFLDISADISLQPKADDGLPLPDVTEEHSPETALTNNNLYQ